VTCTLNINVIPITTNNISALPSGLPAPQITTTNFPGSLQIPLDQYVVGPNLQYSFLSNTTASKLHAVMHSANRRLRRLISHEKKSSKYGDAPATSILHLNNANFTFDQDLSPQNIIFVKMDLQEQLDNNTIYAYV